MSITLSEILGPNVSKEFLDAIKPIQGDLTERPVEAVQRPVPTPSNLRHIQRVFQRYHGCVILCDHCKAQADEYMRNEAEGA